MGWKKLKLLLEKLYIYQFLKNFLFSSFIHLYHYSFIRIHIPLYQISLIKYYLIIKILFRDLAIPKSF